MRFLDRIVFLPVFESKAWLIPMLETLRPWSEEDAATLRRVRRARGHSWHQCVEAMVALGGAEISQGTFSKWENFKASPKLPESVAAVRAYCRLRQEDGPTVSVLDDAAEFNEFSRTVEELLGDRPLTPRQSQVVDALVVRLSAGPPLSDADLGAIQLLWGRPS